MFTSVNVFDQVVTFAVYQQLGESTQGMSKFSTTFSQHIVLLMNDVINVGFSLPVGTFCLLYKSACMMMNVGIKIYLDKV